MGKKSFSAPSDAPGTSSSSHPSLPPWENALNGLNPGGISCSKVWETNVGLTGLKSPVLGGSESRCQCMGWLYLPPPLSSSLGSWEGSKPPTLRWWDHPCRVCPLGRSGRFGGSGVPALS